MAIRTRWLRHAPKEANYMMKNKKKRLRLTLLCRLPRSKSKRRAAARVAFRTIFKVITKLKIGFLGEKISVHKVGYPEDSSMPRSGMRDSTLIVFQTPPSPPWPAPLTTTRPPQQILFHMSFY